MRVHGITAKRKRKFIPTTDLNTCEAKAEASQRSCMPIVENKLNQDFKANMPNKKWVANMDLRQRLCISRPLIFRQKKAGYN
jgi:hypothetical protein